MIFFSCKLTLRMIVFYGTFVYFFLEKKSYFRRKKNLKVKNSDRLRVQTLQQRLKHFPLLGSGQINCCPCS